MTTKTPTPLAPLLRGGPEASPSLSPSSARMEPGQRHTPSPEKGRAGEGFALEAAFFPYNKKLTALARENRNNPTKAESRMWNEVLRMRQFEYKFLRQKPIDNYIVDFYCSEFRLVIEIDGESHAEAVEYDAERTRTLEAFGLTVIRYTNAEVLGNIQGVYDHLYEQITQRSGKIIGV